MSGTTADIDRSFQNNNFRASCNNIIEGSEFHVLITPSSQKEKQVRSRLTTMTTSNYIVDTTRDEEIARALEASDRAEAALELSRSGGAQAAATTTATRSLPRHPRPQPETMRRAALSRVVSDGTWPSPSAVILPPASELRRQSAVIQPPASDTPRKVSSRSQRKTSSVDAVVAEARRTSMLAHQALALEQAAQASGSSSSSIDNTAVVASSKTAARLPRGSSKLAKQALRESTPQVVALVRKDTSVTNSSSASSSPVVSRKSSPSPRTRTVYNGQGGGFVFVDTTTAEDEELARRLAQELQDERLAQELGDEEFATRLDMAEKQRRRRPQEDELDVTAVIVGGGGAPPPSSVGLPPLLYHGHDFDVLSPSSTPQAGRSLTDGDDALARRLAQQEENVLPSRQGGNDGPRPHETQPVPHPRNNGCRSKTIYYGVRIILALMAVGITLVVWLTLFGRNSGLPEVLDPATWMPGFPEKDPFVGKVGDHSRWAPTSESSSGLTLPILDNLVEGSDWAGYLEETVSNWDNGTPDAVTLRILSMDNYDPECRAVRMAMKVCNGDYGPTDWRGVNQVLLQDDYIITSIAKMNDYYLDGTNGAQKQYTMCHELGHGLGLGHSDENFYNQDLGNCMDYTNLPQNNLYPDEYNYLILEELYGRVEGELQDGDALTAEHFDEIPSEGVQDNRESKGGQDIRERSLEDEFETYAAYLLDPIEISLPLSLHHSRDQFRMLHESEHAIHHERVLGNGYTVRTRILLA